MVTLVPHRHHVWVDHGWNLLKRPLPRDQIHLIPTCLGDVIPADHPLRLRIDHTTRAMFRQK
ncbi:MAG: hypothetical protein MUF48_15030 [Pirellulaceae bacterium]|nr:hypothetical protein [Pirellulaceae bacterium]